MSWNEGPRPFTLGLDYDDTYSLDPAFWNHVVAFAKLCGHKVVCVTCRPETQENYDACNIPGVLTYFTGMAPKDWYMREKGIEVDVWVDDSPDCVLHGR
jgi:hypothetical protein